MQKTLIVAAAGACMGLAATVAIYRPNDEQVADFVQSLAQGVILGAGSWPYGLSPVPPELQATLLPRSLDCDAQSQCEVLALGGFIRLPSDADDAE